MTSHRTPPFRTLERLGWASLALVVPLGLGLLLDPRTVDGAPVWLKPAKFAVSIGIYSLTLAWMLPRLTHWPRLARAAAGTTAAALVIELVLITLQAARGTASHFNVATPLDGVIFAVMGAAIALQTLAALAATVALWRQPFDDPALGWALRFGMAIAVAGASVGGLMTQPTRAQLARAEATGRMPRVGQHTVGAEDGGAGLPGTGWSLRHGDLRVPHFAGLHAVQVLPLLALGLARRRSRAADAGLARRLAAADARLVVTAALAYAAFVAVLLAQALLGQPVTTPAGGVRVALTVWALGTAVGLASALGRRHGVRRAIAPAWRVA
ncbi:MAG: hypothetical protein AB7O28_16975 [Vicinamibacterales bacterium]